MFVGKSCPLKTSLDRQATRKQGVLTLIGKKKNHEQIKVLMMLLADLDYVNYIQVAQIDIAETLGMKKPNVSKAVKNLIEFGIILEGPKIGRSKTYRLNPQFGWKGTVSNHKKALKNGLSVIQGGKV